MSSPKLISAAELRKKYGYSKYLVQKLIHAKGSPARRFTPNGKWYFIADELDEFLKKVGALK